jgi:glycosyltransferase involved in cell wall biosynthesis
MLSRDLGGIQQSFLDYDTALTMEGHNVINITSIFAKINEKIDRAIKLPNLFSWCLISKIYLRILISIYKPDLILAHGGRAISFASSFKPNSIPLIGIAHNYKTKRLKKCDYIISITNIMIDYLTSRDFDKKKIFHVPNMKNITHPYQEKKYKNPIIIGSFGRFVAKKGFNYLIEAIFLLKSKNHNVRLLLGGGGEEEAILKKLVKDMNLTKEVTFLGWIEDKDKFFNQIDIFCLPSTSEPFGIILLEAMERSTPIVATKSGGPAEVLRNKKDALLAETESSSDIADKLSELILNPSKATKLSESAHLRLTENYDIKIVSKKLASLLNQIKVKL